MDRSRIKLNYCERMQKYKPQTNNVAAGISFMMISGIHINYSIWLIGFTGTSQWIAEYSLGIIAFLLAIWYIGAIIGSIVGAVIIDYWKKKIIYGIAGVLFVLSGVAFVSIPDSFAFIFIGRILAGFAHGIVYVVTIIHAGENSMREVRGSILGAIGYTTTFGMLIGSLIFSFDYFSYFNVNFFTGILVLIISLMGLVMIPFFTYESVPSLLRSGLEQKAIHNLMKLRSETVETFDIRKDFEEIKLMVNEDTQLGRNIIKEGNLKPLIMMICTRLLYVLSTNLFINFVAILLTIFLIGTSDSYITLTPVALVAARSFGATISLFTLNSFSRKWHLTISGALAGVTFAILGIILLAEIPTYAYVLGIFCIFFQFYIGLGIEPVQHIYLAEAFSSPKSAWSITAVCAVECILQTIIIFIRYTSDVLNISDFFVLVLLSGIAMLFLTFLLHFIVPETRQLSLRDARNVFSKRMYRGAVLSNVGAPGITYVQ